MKCTLCSLAALWMLALLVACASSGGHRANSAGSVEEVQQAERQRFAALIAQDVAALDPMLGDELHYCHSTGRVENKQQFLETVRSGGIRYESIDVHEFQARLYGELAIGTGYITVQGKLGGQPVTLELRYTDVYAWRSGRWQLINWQSTRVAPAPR
jgi:ketosteroid isomerase-like protein